MIKIREKICILMEGQKKPEMLQGLEIVHDLQPQIINTI